MLPKSRIQSALAIGIGLFLVVVGVLAPVLLDKGVQLPMDLKHSTYTLRDEAAHSRVIGKDVEVTAPVTRQTHFEIFPAADEEHATLQVGVTNMRDSMQDEVDRLITASVWSATIDRVTGEITGPMTVTDQLGNPPREVQAEGVWMKFPSDAQQSTYQVFDPLLREALPAEFSQEEQRDGRTLYRYVQRIEPKNVALNYAAVQNTVSIPRDDKQITAYLYHSGTREFLVDQATGLVVGLEEHIDDYYATNTGERVAVGMQFNGSLNEQQAEELLAETDQFPDWHIWRYICWGIAGLGGLLTLIGLFGAFGTGKKQDKPQPEAEDGEGAAPAASDTPQEAAILDQDSTMYIPLKDAPNTAEGQKPSP
ncbi:DUF3068 domain-containing protein [Corynebacterium pelargi]|uniref:Uncharacterized protein n=1 Tax=Corynebacterium pelargi TaxID=1471400 RepID=A0A410WB43_9CORY|nr:DUF3068 domain-containing protein [Corynebacterium pelargi]QAU53188.1 hypothetical protein CPELA_09665 [Corynebacterium pelargi]GGG74199.1 hypothetical protein GCM10007338_09480 [Corynebacterium pelargi]